MKDTVYGPTWEREKEIMHEQAEKFNLIERRKVMMTSKEIELMKNLAYKYQAASELSCAISSAISTIEEMRERIREVCNAYSDGNGKAGIRGVDALDKLEECLK